jgi:hypothetical protein
MNPKFIIKPKFLKPLGVIYHSCQAIYPFIFSPSYVIEEYYSNNPRFVALIEHEFVHLNRIKENGLLKWYLQYVINPKFRLNEELLATKRQFQILRENNLQIDIDQFARNLSSFTYLKMISKDKAKSLLSEL